MFYKTTYRRGVIEAVIIYTIGRLGACITPTFFPDALFLVVFVPLLFLLCQYIIPPYWAAHRIASTKRERLSKRFWLLGLLLAGICWVIDMLVSLAIGLPTGPFGVQLGPGLVRLLDKTSRAHLSSLDFGLFALREAALLCALFMLTVICSKLARGGFLRFTMPAGGNRITL